MAFKDKHVSWKCRRESNVGTLVLPRVVALVRLSTKPRMVKFNTGETPQSYKGFPNMKIIHVFLAKIHVILGILEQ